MAKTKLILSKPQQEILNVLAHIVVSQGIEQNVSGMEGFFKTYTKTLNARQRGIYQAFEDQIKLVRKDTPKLIDADKDFEKHRQ